MTVTLLDIFLLGYIVGSAFWCVKKGDYVKWGISCCILVVSLTVTFFCEGVLKEWLVEKKMVDGETQALACSRFILFTVIWATLGALMWMAFTVIDWWEGYARESYRTLPFFITGSSWGVLKAVISAGFIISQFWLLQPENEVLNGVVSKHVLAISREVVRGITAF